MTTPQQLIAARECVDRLIPFALFSLPGEDGYRFMACSEVGKISANQEPKHDGELVIKPFLPESETLLIRKEYGEDNLPSCLIGFTDEDEAPFESVSRTDYIEYVDKVISHLQAAGGKIVMSRLLAVDSKSHPVDVAAAYFAKHPHAFRYLYYTPQTGIWLGASPELLLEVDNLSRTVRSMALAGTKCDDCTSQWDDKNTEEHQFVVTHILKCFRDSGLAPELHRVDDVKFGPVSHIAHSIEAQGSVDPYRFLDLMSPTPALLGTPSDVALRVITELEKTPRGCYGGWVAYDTDSRFTAHVNLRCAKVRKSGTGYSYGIYVGGGITSKSDSGEEWRETEHKASSLLGVINQDKTV